MKKLFKTLGVIITTLVLGLSLTSCGEKGTQEQKYKTIADLNNAIVGVQTGTLYEDELYKKAPDTTVSFYAIPNDMIIALQNGKVDAFLTESGAFGVIKLNHPWTTTVDEPVCEFGMAIGVGNNEKKEKLSYQINEFVNYANSSGLYDELHKYWVEDYNPDTCFISDELKNSLTGENGSIIIGVEAGYEPFSHYGNNELQGFDIAYCMEFAKAYGYSIEWLVTTYDALPIALETGKADLATNIVPDEERGDSIFLSDPYLIMEIQAVVDSGEGKESSTFFDTIKNSFHKTFIKENRWRQFVSGTLETILITFLAIIFGTIIGFAAYLLCRNGNKIANKIADAIIWVIHGTPTVVFIMILYYIVFGSSTISGTWVSIIGFTLLFACAMFTMIQTGVKAVTPGQIEAAESQGFSKTQTFFKIILPQAIVFFMPTYKSEVVSLIKESSIVGYIAVMDLTKQSDMIRSRTYEAFFPLIATALIYFAIAAIFIFIVKRIELKIDTKHRKKNSILKGITTKE